MKKVLRFLIVSGAAVAFGAFAADDVGLVNQLSGDVSYVSGGHTAKAKAFMKIREGDRFTLPSGSQVRVVYFHNGRQEAYKGAGSFTVGSQQSTVQSGAKPEVSSLPSGVPQKLAQTPDLVQIARLGRSGGVAVRGAGREAPRLTPEQQQEVRQARQTYEQLRKTAAADDINPEYYLYSVLQDYLMYDDMKQVVAEMQKRRPSDPDVAVLTEYVKTRTEGK
jgi:hypothetical protein